MMLTQTDLCILCKNYTVGPGLGFQRGENSRRCLSCLSAAEGPLFSPRQTQHFTQGLLTICWEIQGFSSVIHKNSSETTTGPLNRTYKEWYWPDLQLTELTGQILFLK